MQPTVKEREIAIKEERLEGRGKRGKVKKKCLVDCETVKDKTREIVRRVDNVKGAD